MKRLMIFLAGLTMFAMSTARADIEPAEIYCLIRDTGTTLNCSWVVRGERKTMAPEDIPSFIDQASIMAYVTVKSKKGMERVYLIDSNAAHFRKLADIKKSASISEISKFKNELFTEIERRLIKISDDLDALSNGAELVKYDSSIGVEKFKRQNREQTQELETLRSNRNKVCTSTPEYEKISRANVTLQQTLSSILVAFQGPDSCMADFKVFKDKDGAVDLRQLDGVGQMFSKNCKKSQ